MSSNDDKILQLKEKIEVVAGRAKWYRDQVAGMEKQNSHGSRTTEWWDIRDVIKERRAEARVVEDQLEELKRQLVEQCRQQSSN